MIIDGRAIAKEILDAVRVEVARLPQPPVVRAIVMQASGATDSYLKIKEARAKDAGMVLDIVRISETSVTTDVLASMSARGADALLVQLPLPAGIDTAAVLDAIPLEMDADVLSTIAHAHFEHEAPGALLPPVVEAVKEILHRAGVEPAGKRAVIIGKGWLVGEPCTAWLRAQGANVDVLTRESGDLATMLRDADIVICGAGSPGLVTPQHLSPGVVLIDAGTSESGGAIVGDADPACADVASVFTPVPGGVGPIAVACLFRNAATLALRRGLRTP